MLPMPLELSDDSEDSDIVSVDITIFPRWCGRRHRRYSATLKTTLAAIPTPRSTPAAVAQASDEHG